MAQHKPHDQRGKEKENERKRERDRARERERESDLWENGMEEEVVHDFVSCTNASMTSTQRGES